MSTPTGKQWGDLQKVLIPMIRRIVPNKVAADIIGVQPMSSPSGLIFPGMKLSFEVERAEVKNSDGVQFYIVIYEDAGKGKDDQRKIGIEVLAKYLGVESTVFKESIVLDDADNGFAISSRIIQRFTESVDEITIGSDLSHPRMMSLINGAIEAVKSDEGKDPALQLALAVAKSYG